MKYPQIKAYLIKFIILKPKKPNSALRKVTKTSFSKIGHLYSYIPGIKHSLKFQNKVLIRSASIKDLNSIHTVIIRWCFRFFLVFFVLLLEVNMVLKNMFKYSFSFHSHLNRKRFFRSLILFRSLFPFVSFSFSW
jgi:hypothetical protein